MFFSERITSSQQFSPSLSNHTLWCACVCVSHVFTSIQHYMLRKENTVQILLCSKLQDSKFKGSVYRIAHSDSAATIHFKAKFIWLLFESGNYSRVEFIYFSCVPRPDPHYKICGNSLGIYEVCTHVLLKLLGTLYSTQDYSSIVYAS